jgi:alpha-D-ribose 1-methylphosphonate 5-triphosphate synthase subunit PhnH
MIPSELHTLFWDTNVSEFQPLDFPDYTIARVLELGDQDAVAWLRDTFTEAQIVSVLRMERRLSRRSANFWALVYGVSTDQIAALALVS